MPVKKYTKSLLQFESVKAVANLGEISRRANSIQCWIERRYHEQQDIYMLKLAPLAAVASRRKGKYCICLLR